MFKKIYGSVFRASVDAKEKLPDNLKSSCRLCLTKVGKLNLIFEESHIPAKIHYCTGLKVAEDDGLPPGLCDKCFERLQEFYSFKTLCLESNLKLKQYLERKERFNGKELDNEHDQISLIDETSFTLFENQETLNERKFLLATEDLHPEAPQDIINLKFSTSPPHETAIERVLDEIRMDSDEDQEITLTSIIRNDLPSDSQEDQEDKFSVTKECEGSVEKFEPTPPKGPMKPECVLCGKIFKTKTLIERHMRVHTGIKPYVCSICQKGFSQKETLLRHKKIHDDTFHVCDLCSKVLFTPQGLKCHMMTHHTVREPSQVYRYKCKLCDKAFCHSSGLSRHLLSHSQISFTCQYCSKTFSDSSSHRRHVNNKHPEFRCQPKTPQRHFTKLVGAS